MTDRSSTPGLERRYVSGYGRTKHILDESKPHTDAMNDGYGLCGAFGGYPLDGRDRPVCKRCSKASSSDERR